MTPLREVVGVAVPAPEVRMLAEPAFITAARITAGLTAEQPFDAALPWVRALPRSEPTAHMVARRADTILIRRAISRAPALDSNSHLRALIEARASGLRWSKGRGRANAEAARPRYARCQA
jgi:hypothetical protein